MIEELRRFMLVVEEGNLTKTAKKIHITQSGLSQSINRLEKELGTELFRQDGKYLTLTSEGVAIHMLGERILKLWENAKDSEMRKSFKDVYTVGVFDNAALLLGKYFQQNLNSDDFRFELIIDSSEKLQSLLKLGILDIAIIVIDKNNPSPKNISLVKNFTEKLIPVSGKFFKQKVNQIPFIFYNKGSHTREYIDSAFFQNGIKPTVFTQSTSAMFMKELAMLGSGIAFLPENFIRHELYENRLKKHPLPFQVNREYGIYLSQTGKVKENSAIIKSIIKALENRL